MGRSQGGGGDNYVWVDFGFNHGGRYYLNPEEFDFKWQWKFQANIELFCLSDPNKMSIIDSLQFQKDCIQGTVIGCKRDSVTHLWEWIKDAMRACLLMECMDDDQHLLLMVFRAHKEEFHITICDWYQPIELTCNREFTTRKKPMDENIKRDLKHMEEFVWRVRQRMEKYY